jgi:hypothetical protein
MNDPSGIGQTLLKILVDEGPQSLPDIASKIPKEKRPSKKRNELLEIIGAELTKLRKVDGLVQYDVSFNQWTLTEKYQSPTEAETPAADEPAQMDTDSPAPGPVILDDDPADDPFADYLDDTDPRTFPPIHPYADLFPMMGVDELLALSADIKANGLLEPIVFWRGQLLDGRNRYIGCKRAGVEVREHHLPDDTDPFKYVFSKNIQRRQLNNVQKAVIAEKAATATKGRKKKDGGALSLDEASDIVGIGRSSTALVRQIKENDRVE